MAISLESVRTLQGKLTPAGSSAAPGSADKQAAMAAQLGQLRVQLEANRQPSASRRLDTVRQIVAAENSNAKPSERNIIFIGLKPTLD